MTDQSSKTITGTLTLLPNPCTTKPCLPGMAFAVSAGDVSYFLTRNGGFYMEGAGDQANLPKLGAKVVTSGEVQEKRDVAGKTFRTIELKALRQTD